MAMLVVLLAVAAVIVAGAVYQWHIRRHLPHDLRKVGPEGLPNDASIRSGELGRAAASEVFRNFRG